MIKELMHDPIFLAGKSEVATKEDLQVVKNLFHLQFYALNLRDASCIVQKNMV